QRGDALAALRQIRRRGPARLPGGLAAELTLKLHRGAAPAGTGTCCAPRRSLIGAPAPNDGLAPRGALAPNDEYSLSTTKWNDDDLSCGTPPGREHLGVDLTADR